MVRGVSVVRVARMVTWSVAVVEDLDVERGQQASRMRAGASATGRRRRAAVEQGQVVVLGGGGRRAVSWASVRVRWSYSSAKRARMRAR